MTTATEISKKAFAEITKVMNNLVSDVSGDSPELPEATPASLRDVIISAVTKAKARDPSYYCVDKSDIKPVTRTRRGQSKKDYDFYANGNIRVCGTAKALKPVLKELGLTAKHKVSDDAKLTEAPPRKT